WAGGFCEQRATASAMRWGLAVLFVGGSVLTWCRERFVRLASQTGFAFAGQDFTVSGRIDLVIRPLTSLAGLTVFLLSAVAACLAAGRRLPAGGLLTAQAWLGLTPLLLLGVAPLAWWMIRPQTPLPGDYHLLGRWPGWLALALAFAASFLHGRRHAPTSQAGAM